MKNKIIQPKQSYSIKVPTILFLFIPILNIFLPLTFGHKNFVNLSGLFSITGESLFFGYFVLIITTALLYKKNRILFKGLFSTICISIPIILIISDTQNYTLQTVIIIVSLFFFGYFINYKESADNDNDPFSLPIILHNIMLLCMIIISTKYDLLDVTWNRVSIFIYLILYILFYIYTELFLRDTKFNKKTVITIFSSICLVTTFLIDNEFSFLFAFFYLLFLLYFSLQAVRFNKFLIDLLFENPYKLLISSFALIVLIGSLLLSMPFSSSSDHSILFIDALFTATSAVCVTGLVVLDTYRDFSMIGQGIILVLIQIGGLGIITIMTFISILLGQTIGISKEYVVGEIIGSKRPKLLYDLIKFVVITTLLIETIGSIILTMAFYLKEGNGLQSLWKGVFHTISAFCNAGFALQSDSLIKYNQTYLIPITISVLIIIGGLGFPVIAHLYDVLIKKTEFHRTPLLVSVSIRLTVTLLFLGYLLFLMGEYNASFANLSPFHKHLNAFYLSVTARTAGFNFIDMSQLSGGSILCLWILMFIGAGSCSTAGGIKVTTLGVLIATLISFIKGRSDTILFEKRIPSLFIKRAIILFMTSIALIFFVAIILQFSQNLSLSESMFETLSAFGTVGLSIGATGKLNEFGKFLIAILMFIGRVNILTFISLFVATKTSSIQYSEESFMIG